MLNVTTYLHSENPTIAKLIREIEGSVVEVDEDLLTEEEFKDNLQTVLASLPNKQEKWTASSVHQINSVTIPWESGNPTPSLTTYEHEFA